MQYNDPNKSEYHSWIAIHDITRMNVDQFDLQRHDIQRSVKMKLNQQIRHYTRLSVSAIKRLHSYLSKSQIFQRLLDIDEEMRTAVASGRLTWLQQTHYSDIILRAGYCFVTVNNSFSEKNESTWLILQIISEKIGLNGKSYASKNCPGLKFNREFLLRALVCYFSHLFSPFFRTGLVKPPALFLLRSQSNPTTAFALYVWFNHIGQCNKLNLFVRQQIESIRPFSNLM